MIRPLSEIERETILAAIRELHDIPRAARALGIGRNTAYRKLREYGIPLYRPPGFKVLRARKPAILPGMRNQDAGEHGNPKVIRASCGGSTAGSPRRRLYGKRIARNCYLGFYNEIWNTEVAENTRLGFREIKFYRGYTELFKCRF